VRTTLCFLENSTVKGNNIEKEAVVEVTKLCFNVKHHQCDIDDGDIHFGGLSGNFDSSSYIEPSYSLV